MINLTMYLVVASDFPHLLSSSFLMHFVCVCVCVIYQTVCLKSDVQTKNCFLEK